VEREPAPQRWLKTTRLEAFSDGVFAIAITLLVLEISIPPGSEDDLLRAFLDEWPSYLAYVVSFSTIGALWLAHSAITDYLERTDVWLLRINLVLLMAVAFLPFPTNLLAESMGGDDAEVATTIYGLTLLAVAVLLSVIWRHCVSNDLVRPGTGDGEVRDLTEKLTPGVGGYVAMIVVGIFFPLIAVLGYLLIAIYFLVPSRRHHRAA
jgi:uncharacterized membrane protein